MRSGRARSLLVGGSAVLALLLVAGFDRALPRFVRLPGQGPLFFPPGSTEVFRTAEFHFTAIVNSRGFRDREFGAAKNGRYRILAIGDSFTYGWGVEMEETWVKVLERNLLRSARAAEVVNLGRPGDSPAKYANTAERMIPALRPDLVLIAVLQGDDIAQCEYSLPSKEAPGLAAVRAQVRVVLAAWCPNLLSLLRSPAAPEGVALTWRQQVEQVLAAATKQPRGRFDRLDEPLKQMYLRGELNPTLLITALQTPDYYLKTLHIELPATRVLIDEMARQLARAKAAGDRYGVPVHVLAVPHRPYASEGGWQALRRLGFEVEPAMLTSTAPDQAIRMACEKAGLPFLEVTAAFRKRAAEASLFFDLDGHFNAQGHQVFGDLLSPRLEGYVTGRP